MIHTDDGEIFTISTGQGTLEITRDELEHIVMEGEIILHELREFFVEPNSGNVDL